MIKVDGSYTLHATQTEVWSRIIDPGELVKLIPGCESLEETGPGTYRGLIALTLPAVSGEFEALVTMASQLPPSECYFSGEISGSTGRISGGAQLRLIPAGECTTLEYKAEGVVSGALAKLPQRMIRAAANTLLKQGLGRLDRDLLTQARPK